MTQNDTQPARQPNKPVPQTGTNLMDEPDIGSGEKTPGERETEEHIRQVPPLPEKQDEQPRPPGQP